MADECIEVCKKKVISDMKQLGVGQSMDIRPTCGYLIIKNILFSDVVELAKTNGTSDIVFYTSTEAGTFTEYNLISTEHHYYKVTNPSTTDPVLVAFEAIQEEG